MKKGLLPTPIDPRDKHFASHKHFGVALNFPDNFHRDNGIFPNQNKENRPTECTAYTVADIVSQKGKLISRDFHFMKTLVVMNAKPDSDGADARTAFKVATDIGLLPREDEPNEIAFFTQEEAADPKNWSASLDTVAQGNRIPAYLPIKAVPDYFDGIRSAILLREQTTVGIATQWSPSFETPGSILTETPENLYWGHMYECVGWKTIDGVPYLTLKTWQGPEFDDGGYCYMSRTLCNKLLSAWGAYAAAYDYLPQTTIDQLKDRRVSLIETAIALAKNLLGLLLYQLTHGA